MATKKLSPRQIGSLALEYERGSKPDLLATEFKIHPSTVRRYLNQCGKKLTQEACVRRMGKRERMEMRRILEGVERAEDILDQIDSAFTLSLREPDSDFKIINVKGV